MAQLTRTGLTRRELATVLAALRYWQREGLVSSGHETDIATDGGTLKPMSLEAIDDLCERLNTDWKRGPIVDPASQRFTSAADLAIIDQSRPYQDRMKREGK